MNEKPCTRYSPAEWNEFIEEFHDSLALSEVRNRTKLGIKHIRRMHEFANKHVTHPLLPLRDLPSGTKRRSTPVDYSQFGEVYRSCDSRQQACNRLNISKTELNRRIGKYEAENDIKLPELPETTIESATQVKPFRRLRHGSNPTDLARKLGGTRYEDTKPSARYKMNYVAAYRLARKFRAHKESQQ